MAITGVIRPPPEIRAVADRTASYVAKNGRTFEQRILKSAKGKTPKFAFLQPTSPFHAYYEDRIQFYENGGEDEDPAAAAAAEEKKKSQAAASSKNDDGTQKTVTGDAGTGIRKTEKTQVASAIDPIAKALLAQRAKIMQAKSQKKEQAERSAVAAAENGGGDATVMIHAPSLAAAIPPPPPLDLVTIVAPANLSPSQMEVIQLVAQYAALDGKGGSFLHQLSLREWSNPEFSFCQPRHSHFAYFSALVDAYRRIISLWTAAVMDKEERKDEAGDMETNATAAAASAKKDQDLQAALEEAAYRAEYERETEQQRSQQHEEGEVVAIDWHDFVVVETIDFPVDEKVELNMLPPPPPPPPSTLAAAPEPQPSAAAAGETMDESSDDEEEENIRVVPSYTPKVVGTANPQAARAIDPITGKSVSVADVPEHLRIQLLDPKWAEERKKFQDKQKESNLVAGDAIVSNLSRYSQARGDLFGKSEQELLDKEKDSKRRLEQANRIIREQANQPAPPGFAPIASAGAQSSEPSAKRMRMDGALPGAGTGVAFPPPPPPPTMPQQAAVPPPPPPPAAGGLPGIMGQPSGNAMADAMLLANTTTATDETSGTELLSEAEFAASLSKPEVTLQIRIPNDPTQMAWNFYGQILSLTMNVMSTIKEVKADLSRIHLNSMPVNKIQLKDPNAGFYNNNNATLAALNVGPTATLEMLPKSRGGRRT